MLLTVLDRQNSNRGESLAHHQPAEHPDALTHKMRWVNDPVFDHNVSSPEVFNCSFQGKGPERGRLKIKRSPAVCQFQTERARLN